MMMNWAYEIGLVCEDDDELGMMMNWVLRDPSQLATLDLHQLTTPSPVVDNLPSGSVGLIEQPSPPSPAPARATLDLIAAPVPYDTALAIPEPDAALLSQPLLVVPPAPPLPSHPMVTRLRDGIKQPKVRTDGTIRKIRWLDFFKKPLGSLNADTPGGNNTSVESSFDDAAKTVFPFGSAWTLLSASTLVAFLFFFD
ncbi:hypothetical protein LWI28_025806 [Acer negundo]|uniref:Uncharacterized protein n=1 Tax=Acer negundo TaxID=4023 RepID=A0AAD5NYG3_ACENE|nr:hypothetical protein LWI28_025806 [Acer negundo]